PVGGQRCRDGPWQQHGKLRVLPEREPRRSVATLAEVELVPVLQLLLLDEGIDLWVVLLVESLQVVLRRRAKQVAVRARQVLKEERVRFGEDEPARELVHQLELRRLAAWRQPLGEDRKQVLVA